MDMIYILVNIIVFLAFAPLFEGIVRKLTAKVQSRQGPPIVQPYYDLIKLLGKENLVVDNWAFKIAPLFSFAAILSVICFIPFGYKSNFLTNYADVITVIYLLTMGGVSILLGALSSRNTYAMMGASREMVTMIMVEPVLAMTFFVGAVKVKSLAIDSTIFSVMNTGYSWAVVLMLVLYLMALQAFVGKQPFDIAEAEQEILEGPFIEYSGPNYALFKYAMMLKQMFYAALFVMVFVPFLNTGIYILNIAVQLVLIALVYVVIALVGATNPRLRIDQAVKYYSVLIILSLGAVGLSVYGI
ncbi:MAG TPA: NADH-quinone oxidoreductase subunit H [Spirochaetota bacterium]|nr:NADH-quinone oxidoreductase subunit H [Spirochaetota bacterium]HOK91829.1 NADH-quinone oxidoreductase subunit H [Spirochaetota bacterium]HON15259.1 NADH-quinone oxidoreductase subunit H [Spirochaetota bacterium]HPP94426.1 NADH-quinone oxidoreductase subunit H [Spirochaetota bacterium]HRS62856.1 NADH-quinone oxidoreductase subunit H [Spirochaetota bacterium]